MTDQGDAKVRQLERALSDECANSLRLAQENAKLREALAEIAQMGDGPYSMASDVAAVVLAALNSQGGSDAA